MFVPEFIGIMLGTLAVVGHCALNYILYIASLIASYMQSNEVFIAN